MAAVLGDGVNGRKALSTKIVGRPVDANTVQRLYKKHDLTRETQERFDGLRKRFAIGVEVSLLEERIERLPAGTAYVMLPDSCHPVPASAVDAARCMRTDVRSTLFQTYER
jgi:hypothetical protein